MAMRVMQLPRRIGNAIDNVNAGVDDFRRGVTTLLLPLKILVWASLVIVGYETVRGDYGTHSMAHRTMSSAVDQFWYVLFYSSVPGIWHLCLTCIQRVRRHREWTLIGPNVPPRVDNDGIDMDEWVIVDSVGNDL